VRQLIEAGLVLAGKTLSPLADACLVVEDGLVDEVRTTRPTGAFDGVERFPTGVVMPGLIDTHVHLQLTPGPDHATGRATYARDRDAGMLTLRAMQNARLALSAGLTTVRDVAADMSILAVRAAIDGGDPGPRLLVSGLPITTTGGHCHWFGDLRADNADEVRRATRWLAEQGVDVIKVMASGGIMTPGTNATAPQYSAAEVTVAVVEAHRLGRRVVAHALNVEAIRNCVDAGVDSIDHCAWRLPNDSLAYDAELGERIAGGGAVVGVTGSGILRILLAQGDAGRDELRRTLAAHRQLFLAGARVGVHSDAGVRFTPVDRFDLTLQVMMVGLDVAPRDCLVAATSTAADAVGLGDEVGAIEVGKRADLVVLDGDPLADLGNVRRVTAVFRDGAKLVAKGRIVVPAPAEVAPAREVPQAGLAAGVHP
jgi:imidazolonepropionase-like amidohydrolase